MLITVAFLTVSFSMPLQAQKQEDKQQEQKKKKADKPVRSPWSSGVLIDTQTGKVLRKKSLEFNIQHRFGNINSGTFDLLGIYGASNIRLGLSYGLFKNFQIGIGTTKNNKYQDINWKYKFLTQTRSNSMPVSLAYYGNMAFTAFEKDYYGANYKLAHRISYFHQLILGRKFSRWLTLQVSFQYAHFNFIDTTSISGAIHDNFGAGLAGRIKISPQTSIAFEYDQPLNTSANIKPNLSLGIDVGTAGHVFQIFVTTYNGIIPQENLAFNTNEFFKGDVSLGFNITRIWIF